MATLVLTAIGTAIGGPLGGAFGALAGQTADALILKPGGREGPRLADLQVQTSRYGDRVPQIFGRMRVAGTVIWSTDLLEVASTAGGKGQPSVTNYSYSASFAVALSGRAIAGIGRIWADGNLLRGSAGDFKAPLGALRVHHGRPGQAVDPLIAAAVGLDQAPACRDMAYVVFEELQLADFGNRIPSLTVEVIADAAAMPITELAAALLNRPVAFLGANEPLIAGYAADGSDCGAALAPLIEAHGLRWRADGDGLALVDAVATGRTLPIASALRMAEGRAEILGTKRCTPLDQVPGRLAVRHFDPDRDYQAGMQMAERAGPGLGDEEFGLPALLAADAGRGLANAILRRRLRERRAIARAYGWTALVLKVGDLVALEGEQGEWRVDALEWEAMAARLTLRSHASGSAVPMPGDSGQPVREPDLVQGATSLAALELPPLDGALSDRPRLFAGATGADAGWRRAALFHYRPEMEVAEPIGGTAPRAILGSALTVLSAGQPWMIDTRHHVDIMLDNAADSLLGADDMALMGGANLCAVGPELLLFGEAAPIGPKRYRLSRLIRGWRGTEWACALHEAGERFLLVDPARLAAVPALAADIGTALVLRALGAGDAAAVDLTLPVDGRSVLPPAPVHGIMTDPGMGALHFGWTRRSRAGWSWIDGADAPLGEESEAYAVAVMAGSDRLRSAATAAPQWTYAAAERALDLDLAGGRPLRVEIRQVGTHGAGRPLLFTMP